MRRALALAALLLTTGAAQVDFKPYPGSTADPALAAEIAAPFLRFGGIKTQVWTSTDSFEKVLSYYRRVGNEIVLKRPVRVEMPYEHELPARMIEGAAADGPGVLVKEVHFTLDGAGSLAGAHRWLTITHPVFAKATIDGLAVTLGDKREITAIELFERP